MLSPPNPLGPGGCLTSCGIPQATKSGQLWPAGVATAQVPPGTAKNSSRDAPPSVWGHSGKSCPPAPRKLLSPAGPGDQESLPSLTQARNRERETPAGQALVTHLYNGYKAALSMVLGEQGGIHSLGAVAGTWELHMQILEDTRRKKKPVGKLPTPTLRGTP